MSIEAEKRRLAQEKNLEQWQRKIPLTEMLTVYLSDRDGPFDKGICCALIPSASLEKVLSAVAWDFSHGQGLPEAVIRHESGEEIVQYLRYGSSNRIEPLVIERNFYGLREDYNELSEEFRLFHRLFHDQKKNQYLKIDDDGNETLVAILKPKIVQIRLKEIRQFLAVKEMYLSFQFDYREFSKYSLQELGVQKEFSEHSSDFMCWSHGYGDFGSSCNGHRAFSRVLGKRLIPPLAKKKSGLWGFLEESKKKFVDFIIAIGDDAEELSYSADPDLLANHFGANPDAPSYLTPVFFRKEVLNKYYQQPSKYSVEDSILRCGHLWSLYIDNHHADKVCAWLGDLGRDLSYEEQLHWRSHNILPAGGISDTYFGRQISAQFCDSEQLEHLFVTRYKELQVQCEKHLGWQLFLPLEPGDKYHLKNVRIPSTDEQLEFDEVVMGLTKIIVDSLNEKRLNKFLSSEQISDLKGSISKLEAVLLVCECEDATSHLTFLRRLQKVRSSGAAHRKGKTYQKITKTLDAEELGLSGMFGRLLGDAVNLLEYLILIVRSEKLCS